MPCVRWNIFATRSYSFLILVIGALFAHLLFGCARILSASFFLSCTFLPCSSQSIPNSSAWTQHVVGVCQSLTLASLAFVLLTEVLLVRGGVMASRLRVLAWILFKLTWLRWYPAYKSAPLAAVVLNKSSTSCIAKLAWIVGAVRRSSLIDFPKLRADYMCTFLSANNKWRLLLTDYSRPWTVRDDQVQV